MSCIFCESVYHCSEYCEEFTSNEARKEVLRKIGLCETCLLPEGEGRWHPDGCYPKPKCNICFNCGLSLREYHSTVFCLKRNPTPPLFFPKIDDNLMRRFLQCFDPFEKYPLFAISSPRAMNSIPMKSLKVLKEKTKLEDILLIRESLVFLDIDELELDYECTTAIFEEITKALMNKTLIVDAHNLIFRNNASISRDGFLQLCSTSNLKELHLIRTTLDSEISFIDIIKRNPNLRIMELIQTNINVESSWPEDLLKYKTGKDLEFLSIDIQNFDFNVDALTKLIDVSLLVFVTMEKPETSSTIYRYSEIQEDYEIINWQLTSTKKFLCSKNCDRYFEYFGSDEMDVETFFSTIVFSPHEECEPNDHSVIQNALTREEQEIRNKEKMENRRSLKLQYPYDELPLSSMEYFKLKNYVYEGNRPIRNNCPEGNNIFYCMNKKYYYKYLGAEEMNMEKFFSKIALHDCGKNSHTLQNYYRFSWA